MRRRSALAAVTASVIAFAALLGLGSAAVTVSQSGWSWGNPAPQGNTLTASDFVQRRGYAVRAAGTVLRADNGGATWSGLNTGSAADLDRLQVIDPETLVVLGGGGCVLRRSDDGGATFHKIFIATETSCPAPVRAATFFDQQTGYILLKDGSLLRTTDAGQLFARQTAVPGTQASNNATGRQAYALVGDNHLFFTNVGSHAGKPSGLSVKPSVKGFTAKSLKNAKGKLTLTGTLLGAIGGEQIVVSRRDVAGGRWRHQTVVAGANGGSFTTAWKIKRSSVFVAQWRGDSGRRGEASTPVTVKVQVPAKKKSKKQ